MNKDNDKSESINEQPKSSSIFNQKQYDMLKSCSDKKDMTEWNERRNQHQEDKIRLVGANLQKAELQKAKLQGAEVSPKQLALAASFEGAALPAGMVHE